jgi:hypothetical protein
MMYATCVTDECSEQNVAKDMEVRLQPDEMVVCGVCGQPCELTED